MAELETVIKGLECCIKETEVCNDLGCPYFVGKLTKDCIGALMRDALELMKNRSKEYVSWAKEIGVHTCATCKRADCDCPIENEYVLPKDGYCHLWDGGEPKCGF